jgi:hypothetical protein
MPAPASMPRSPRFADASRLRLRGLEAEAAWIEKHRQLWDAAFDALDKTVEEWMLKEEFDGRNRR